MLLISMLPLSSGCLDVPPPLPDTCPCDTGWICDQRLNKCVQAPADDFPAPPSRPDGGEPTDLDSAVSDGGDGGSITEPTADAGPPDTSDAGDLDAGDLDAGDLDAGDLDAGDLDAGDLDAGDLDAGVDDAGASDAGPILTEDAGPVCGDGPATTWWRDADGDGFGDGAQAVQACSQPPAHVANDDDCDDSKVTTYPDAPELCDTLDNDCNAGTADQCPAQCTPRISDGHLYWFCSTMLNWQAASLACANGGLSLVRLDSSAENDFVRAGAVEFLGGLDVWLGGSDSAEQGVWRWSDGDVFWRGTATGTAENGVYTKWATGQPSAGAGEDCTELRTGNRWNDVTCDLLRQFVCER